MTTNSDISVVSAIDDLAKAVASAKLKANTRADGAAAVDVGAEAKWTPASHQEHHDWMDRAQDPVAGKTEADRGCSHKEVYKTTTNDGKPARILAKPYFEVNDLIKLPHTGWAEMTSQSLYHKAGIGHLHQQVHVANADGAHPLIAIHMAPGHQEIGLDRGAVSSLRPEAAEEARRITFMDWLAGQPDRHYENIMVSNKNEPLVIDNGMAFQYPGHAPRTVYRQHTESAIDTLHPLGAAGRSTPVPSDNPVERRLQRLRDTEARARHGEKEYQQTLAWWREVGQGIRDTMEERLRLIREPKLRMHVKNNFEARANHLDDAAAGRAPLLTTSVNVLPYQR